VFSGQGNAILVAPRLRVLDQHTLVLNFDQRDKRLAADRDQAFLGPLATGTEHGGLQVEIPYLQVDRFTGPQPARVHHLEQCAIAQRGWLAAARHGQQVLDLGVVEDVGQLARAARRDQRRGWVLGDQLLAPQVLVEGTQAGCLAVDRRSGTGGPAVPSRKLGQELRHVGGPDRERIGAPLGEKGAVLKKVGAVGVEGVARQPPLEFEVGEEIEHKALETIARLGRRVGTLAQTELRAVDDALKVVLGLF